ncbi:hypothetical protein XENORESO_014769 [Xenotaenia resolanae]|uniref:Uncharacterized protein n=1 Tax=Xenotaenia resolanae TaxID=208358 RepID=A0ABV0X6K7_9TELE
MSFPDMTAVAEKGKRRSSSGSVFPGGSSGPQRAGSRALPVSEYNESMACFPLEFNLQEYLLPCFPGDAHHAQYSRGAKLHYNTTKMAWTNHFSSFVASFSCFT